MHRGREGKSNGIEEGTTHYQYPAAQVISEADGPVAAMTAAFVGQGTFAEKLRALGAYAGGSGGQILVGGTAAPLSAGSGATTAVLQTFEASTQVLLASIIGNCDPSVVHSVWLSSSSMLPLCYTYVTAVQRTSAGGPRSQPSRPHHPNGCLFTTPIKRHCRQPKQLGRIISHTIVCAYQWRTKCSPITGNQ